MAKSTWGIRFNEFLDYRRVGKVQKPEGCPEWLESHHFHNWQEQGLIIWNNINRKLETLNGTESLKLLSELNSQEAWKSNGVSITRLVHRFELNLPSRKKRKIGEPDPEVEIPKGEDVHEEIMQLPPKAGYELIELLESKSNSLPIWQSRRKNAFKRR
jgi:hypothetical protein